MLSFSILGFSPHPKSLSNGEGLLAPSPLEKGLGMRSKSNRNRQILKHDKVGSIIVQV